MEREESIPKKQKKKLTWTYVDVWETEERTQICDVGANFFVGLGAGGKGGSRGRGYGWGPLGRPPVSPHAPPSCCHYHHPRQDFGEKSLKKLFSFQIFLRLLAPIRCPLLLIFNWIRISADNRVRVLLSVTISCLSTK